MAIQRKCEYCGKMFLYKGLNCGNGKFCSRSCATSGKNNPRWTGGKRLKNGYIYSRVLGDSNGREQKKHRIVMEQHLGRPLRKDEHVHHINRCKVDNRIKNLQLISATEHFKLHAEERKKRKSR